MCNDFFDENIPEKALEILKTDFDTSDLFQGDKNTIKKHLDQVRSSCDKEFFSSSFRRLMVLAERQQITHVKNYPSAVGCANTIKQLAGPAVLKGAREDKVVYLGPMKFGTDIWNLRAKYILPDLFGPLHYKAQIIMLIPTPPDSALSGIYDLAEKFSVSVFTFEPSGEDNLSEWIAAASSLLGEYGPVKTVTNIQGHTFFGRVLAQLKHRFNFSSVLRVGGDELVSRIELEAYRSASSLSRDFLNEIYAFHNANRILCMSTWEKERITFVVVDHEKVQVVYRGVDCDFFGKIANRAEPDWDFRNEKKILYLGRKSAEKGWESVVNLARIAECKNLNFKFYFAGSGFPIESIRNQEYLGFVLPDKLPELLADMDAIVLFSSTEGFPQVLMEALAAGRVCFVRDSFYKKMLQDCPGVIWVSEDPAKAIAKMESVMSSSSDISFRKEIREYAKKFFDKDACGKLYASHILMADDVS